jgi:hypothetical protein
MTGRNGCGHRSARIKTAAGRVVHVGDRIAQGKKVMARHIAQAFADLRLTANRTRFRDER